MSAIVDTATVFIQPITKLTEAICKGTGKLYEPTHIRRMAKAKADEYKIISEALTQGLYLPAKYENGELTIDVTAQTELVQRAQQRFLHQELKKQENIESVIGITYNELENETEVSNESVDEDWILRFFNCVQDINNEQMQQIWAKILAGEIKQPNSFSLRTLESLKLLSKQEAELFEKISQNVIFTGDQYIIETYEYKLHKLFAFEDLAKLSECGLLDIYDNIKYAKPITSNSKSVMFAGNDNLMIEFIYNYSAAELPIYRYTEFGKQLVSALGILCSDERLVQFANYARDRYNLADVKLHKLSDKEKAKFNTDSVSLLKTIPRVTHDDIYYPTNDM